MPTQSEQRPGRAPGPHASRPRIAETMARVVECCTLASEWCDQFAPVSARDLLEVVLDKIPDPSHDVADAVVSGLLHAVRSRAAGRRRRLPSEATRTGLYACWNATTLDDTSVDRAVKRLSAAGFDGERLCWAVICRESCNHIPLVRREANRMARLWSDRSGDDLVGYGWRGLRLALRAYDPAQSWFSTYACPKIRGTIRDGVRNEHHLPKRLTTFVNKVELARDELAAAMSTAPTLADIARRLDVDEAKVRATAYYAAPVSLTDTDAEPGVGDDQVDVEAIVEHRALAAAVAAAVSDLPAEEAEAVELLVLQQVPMREARTMTGASPKQLRARRDRGLVSLRAVLGAWVDASESTTDEPVLHRSV